MKYVCKYNEKKDVSAVQPGLDLDLNEAIRQGAVVDTGENLDYNGITELDNVGSRVDDVFDALDAHRAIKSRKDGSAGSSLSEPSTPAGENG